ncbi:WLM domain-containing protein [Podospora fimiseda]|uniref:WLM domain-containing protein n=1 Tax=Podospora fimiseda TaxID=252190 RepID=A0AAN7BRG2_9PEZI|nr:WLM domain-containing protein [Podospora fimiseda]
MATAPDTPATPSDSPDIDTVHITIKFTPESINQSFELPSDNIYTDLLTELSENLPEYDWTKSKALVEKKPSSDFRKTLLTPANDASLPLSSLQNATLRFLASKHQTISDISDAQRAAAARNNQRAPVPQGQIQRIRLFSSSFESQFDFHVVRALTRFPNHAAALDLLIRLKNDPGIKGVMKRNKFQVELLTEMDPMSNTEATPGGGVRRLLGLNRNKGEVIELRLRSDDYAGFRDYNTIRNTLCHELAHNVHGDHNSDFWALTRKFEREVARMSDTGRTLDGQTARYGYADGPPGRGDDVCDHGGWIGGEYVLGGSGEGGEGEGAKSRREIRLEAAESRRKAVQEAKDKAARKRNARRREGPGDSTSA